GVRPMPARGLASWSLECVLGTGMDSSPTTLEGMHVRLEPLSFAHEHALNLAAADGELWNSRVTTVPRPAAMHVYIDASLQAQARGTELPFAIVRKSTN